MRKSLFVILLLAVFISCKKDNDDDDNGNTPTPVQELTYQGTTDQNKTITIKIKGNLLTYLDLRFEFVSGNVGVNKYSTEGIATFENNAFDFVFPDPVDPQVIKKGSAISGTLTNNAFTGTYNITRIDNMENIQGTFTATSSK